MTERKEKPPANPPVRKPLTPLKPPVLERIEPPRAPRPPLDRNRIMVVCALVVVAGQLLLPETLKPFHLAGDAAAQFHGALFDEVNRKELELAQQRAIAERMADLQADYATWKGLCSLTLTLDPQAGALCLQAADAHFENALRQLRSSDLNYR